MVKRLIIVIVLLVAALGGIFGFKYQQMQQMAAMLSAPRPPAVVAATEVVTEQWQPTLHAVGSVVAVNGIDVTAEVDGMVSAIHFQSGQPVKKGDVLIELDATVDRASLEGARADRRLAKVELDRFSDLIARKAVSKSDYDAARARYDAAVARVAEFQARLDKKTIRAPFDGLLGIRAVNLGQYLSKGTRIVPLQALDPILVDYTVPERHIRDLAVGRTVNVIVDAYPDETFTGRISAIEAGVNPGSRSVGIRATLPNPDSRLRPGMFAEVSTLQGGLVDVLTVPRTAVSFNTYGDYVYVIEESAEGGLSVKRRQVETGAARAGRVVIDKGVSAGERVVRAGLVKLRDGAPVQIDNAVELVDAEVTGQ